MSYGHRTDIGISFQNSYGTPLVNSIYWLPFLSEEFVLSKEQIVSEGIMGVYDEGINYEGKNTISAKLEIEVATIPIGVLLKALCGAPTTVNSGTFYTHTFKPRTSDFGNYAASNPVTVPKNLNDGGSAHQFYDMVASKIGFSVANGEFLKASVEFMGGKYRQVAGVAASYPTGKNMTWDVASISLGGAANADLTDLSIDLDESIESKHTLNGSLFSSRSKRSGRRTVAVGGTLVFDDQTEYQQFLAQSERELIVTFTNGTSVSSGYYEMIKFQIPLMRYTEFKVAAGGPGKLEVGFSSKGVYSPSSATAIQITLVNTQAAY